MESRNRFSDFANKSYDRPDASFDKKGYDREDRRDNKYDRKEDRGFDKFFSSGADYQYQGFKGGITDTKGQAQVEKSFYKEVDSVKNRSSSDVKEFRDTNKIVVKSDGAPNPITTFQESSFPSYILDVIKTKGFEKPSPIQSQGWPIVLKGHDLIAIAQTGSGKTLGFLLPAIVHIKAQEPLNRGDGPIALVLAPTRELAMQINEEFKPFSFSTRLKATSVYGGADRYSQKKALRNGCEVVIATPGRLLDFLESGDTNLKRVSYLVIDEADRMLDMGFIPQIEKIVEYIRKDRQTLMWSATWPKEVRKLADDLCKQKPVHIVVGNDDLAVNKAVTQLVKVVNHREKFDHLLRLLQGIYDGCKIIIFAQTKRNCDWLSSILQNKGYRAVSIHGDKSQHERDQIMGLFKDSKVPILIATSLAARGLDVKDIRFVINYDFPLQVEEYVHRVGRSGRGGAVGTSFTFFTEDDFKNAKDLIKILMDNGQKVPHELWGMVSDRRFKDTMQRYDKAAPAPKDAVKDFSHYENLKPVYVDQYKGAGENGNNYVGSNTYNAQAGTMNGGYGNNNNNNNRGRNNRRW